MSVFRRIFNILKSEMSHRWSENRSTDSTGSSKKNEYDWTEYQHDNRTSGSDAPPPKDHKLAQYYANLEVPYGSDLQTVHKAWKKQLSKYHPDLYSTDPEKQQVAHELTQQLNTAYQELKKHLKSS